MRNFLFFLLFISSSAVAQVNISPNGIRSSKLNIELAHESKSLSMLDSFVGNYRLYFTGENHLFRSSNYKLELKLMQYLHNKAGVNHLLLEFGQSVGYLVDDYVKTGDSASHTILKHYFYPEYLKLFEGIREYNQGLDSTNRIYVHGIDLERAPEITIKVLSLFMPTDLNNLPDSIATGIEAIIGLASHFDNQKINRQADKSKSKPYYSWNSQTYSLTKSVNLILKEYNNNKLTYKELIGEGFIVFDSIMRDLEKSYVWNDLSNDRTIQQAIYREKFLYSRFIALHDTYPEGSFYGQFGRCHIMTDENDPNCAYEAFRSLAKRVNEDERSPLCGKVLPLPVYYLRTSYKYNDAHITEKLIKELKLKDYEGVTLVEINNDSTYFKDIPKGFSHLMVNTFMSDDNSYASSTQPNTSVSNYKTYSSFDIFTQMGWFANDNFGSFMRNYSPNFSAFNAYGIGFTSYGKKQGFASIRTSIYDVHNSAGGDSLKLNLNGFESTFWLGYSPLAGKRGAFSLFGGIGFANWKLKETIIRENPNPTTESHFLPPSDKISTTHIYRNPSLVFDLGSDLRLKFGFMYLTFSGAYRFDVSSEQWRNSGKRLENSPGKNNGGFFIQSGIGFNLD